MPADLFDIPQSSEDRNAVELRGCIVCAKIHHMLVVYASDGRQKYWTVTSPGGHVVPDDERPLVACDSHSAAQIDAAYKRWQALQEQDPWKEDDE